MSTEVSPISRTKYLYLRVLTSVAPATGRRRVWAKLDRLETQLAAANHRIEELETHLDIQAGYLANSNEDLLEAHEIIMDLQDQLAIAHRYNGYNDRRFSFVFDDQPLTPYTERDTSAIDVGELRADLADSGPLTGKVTQPNPDTGNHETVETNLSALDKAVTAYRLASVRIAQRGPFFASPTNVPGMRVS